MTALNSNYKNRRAHLEKLTRNQDKIINQLKGQLEAEKQNAFTRVKELEQQVYKLQHRGFLARVFNK